ncbi:hypothetical protein BGS_0512 [Beggiatoa sp. SS]|nr:hypothetical protein BGS_0512 [Beggiatoa sp. SS]
MMNIQGRKITFEFFDISPGIARSKRETFGLTLFQAKGTASQYSGVLKTGTQMNKKTLFK